MALPAPPCPPPSPLPPDAAHARAPGRAECLHGVMDTDPLGELTPEDAARGTTSFPMPLGQAAAFDPALVAAVAGAISDEARAKSNIYRTTTGTVRCGALGGDLAVLP